MCCDICPYYDECQELDKLQESCCSECPDYAECSRTPYRTGEEYKDTTEDENSEEF